MRIRILKLFNAAPLLLQDLYGINEAKIQAYSPHEVQKIYERPVNRKANARFNPKATVESIKQGGNTITPTQLLEEEGRRDLVAKYLGVSPPSLLYLTLITADVGIIGPQVFEA